MIKTVFPLGNGAGIYDGQKLCVCVVDESGNKKVGGNLIKKEGKVLSFPFFRGIFYFLFGFVLYFRTAIVSKSIVGGEKSTKKYKITKRITITSDFILLFASIICAFIIGLVGFKFLPNLIFNRLFGNVYDALLKGFIIGLIKSIILIFIFIFLKFCPFLNEIYAFNGAGCKYLEEKNKKETLIWRAYPLNFLNFLLNVSILSSFMVSLVAIDISSIARVFINIGIYFACICVIYEIMYFTIRFNYSWLKDISMLTNFWVCNKPKITHNEVLTVIQKEMTNYNDFDTASNDRISLSSVYAEMETKLKTSDKFEQSDVDWIVCNVLNKNRAEVKLIRSVSQKEYRDIMRYCDRKAKGEPLSNIFGFVEFYGLRFDVNKKVLSPRMETEILVEEVIKKINQYGFENVLDLCTGSGAIAISIAKFTDCKVTASDISKQALTIAQSNAQKNGVKVEFVHSDLFNGLKKTKKYDIIVSNPPYIRRDEIEKLDVEVKNYDPKLALDGGEDGLDFYRKITEKAYEKLNKGGFLFFEIGNEQRKDVQLLLEQNGFEDVTVIKDYNKIERIVYGRKRT